MSSQADLVPTDALSRNIPVFALSPTVTDPDDSSYFISAARGCHSCCCISSCTQCFVTHCANMATSTQKLAVITWFVLSHLSC